MPATFHRDRLTWLLYLLLAFYGYFINIFGPITPFLKDELGLSYTVSSLHYTAFALGMLLVGLGGHLIVERTGRRMAVWWGVLGMCAGALLLALGRTPLLTIGASFLMGTVGSLVFGVVPSAIADHQGPHSPVAMSEANTTASLLATSAPLLVGWFAASVLGWRFALVLAVLAAALMGWAFWRVDFPATSAASNAVGKHRLPLPGIFWLYWVAQFLGVAVEFCMIFWSADYLQSSLGLTQVAAAQAVSLFLAAMILGRFSGSWLVRRFSTYGVLIGSALLAIAGFVAFWWAPLPWVGLAGLFVTGLGVANLYPLIISLAMVAAAGDTVQAGARSTLASGAAILALPLALGGLADNIGIRPAYGVVALLLLGVLGIVLFTRTLNLPASAS